MSVFVGALTTAHARLMLYELLEKLGDHVIYCDTDSVVFWSCDDDWIPPLGPYVDDLMYEINEGELCGTEQEDFITDYVSAGPKFYAYHTSEHKTTIKCNSVTLNAKNAVLITKDTLVKLVKQLCE